MNNEFEQQFAALLEKYSELLVGSANKEITEKVKLFSIYSHIAKSMPALAKHWNGMYPEAKLTITQIINEIKLLNEEHRKNGSK